MKMEDIRALRGEPVAVEFPVDEAGQGFGSGRGIVRATVVEAPHEFTEDPQYGRPKALKGARLRLAAPFRRRSGDPAGFAELPAGHEFDAESRLILRPWGGADVFRSSGSHHGISDDEREEWRARRYVEQDIVRERLKALGLRETTRGVGASDGRFHLKGEDVVIDRATAAWLLVRADPVEVARKVLAGVQSRHARSEEEYFDAVDAELARQRRWLALTPAEERAALAADPESF